MVQYHVLIGPVAQLASASVWHTEGQGFESPQVHFRFQHKLLFVLDLFVGQRHGGDFVGFLEPD
jgi:hypothetical protein